MSAREKERESRIRGFHTTRIDQADTDRAKADAAYNLWRAAVARLSPEQQAAERARLTDQLVTRAGDLRGRKQ